MSTAELKLDLFRKLDSLSPDKLKKAYGLLSNFLNKNNKSDFWDELSEAEKKAINEGLKQLDSGQSYTYDEVRNKIRKDLKI
jgi:hypothetical protein